MIEVYIWNKNILKGSFGHASVRIQKKTHISYWPSKRRYSAIPLEHSLEDDIEKFKGFKPKPIIIKGLDEKSIIEWWKRFRVIGKFQGPPQAWNLMKLSCATVAAKALKIGGGDQYAKMYSSPNLAWTPKYVYKYAKEIQKNINK